MTIVTIYPRELQKLCDYSHILSEKLQKLFDCSHNFSQNSKYCDNSYTIFGVLKILGKIVTIVTHIFDFLKMDGKMTFLENRFWCALKLSDRAPKPLVRSYWSMRFFWNVSQLDSVLTGLPRGHQKCLLIDGTPCMSHIKNNEKYHRSLSWSTTEIARHAPNSFQEGRGGGTVINSSLICPMSCIKRYKKTRSL